MKEIVLVAALGAAVFSGFYAERSRAVTPPPSCDPLPLRSCAPPPRFDATAATARARELVESTLVRPLTAARRDRLIFSRAGPDHPIPAVTVELDPATGPLVTGTLHRGIRTPAPERLRIDTRSGEVTVTTGDQPAVTAAEYTAQAR
jgi:hypothetical protein